MPRVVKIGNQVIDPENPGIDRPVVIKEFEVDDPGAERAIEMLSYGFACVPKLYHVEKTQDSTKIYQEFIEGTHLYDLNPGTLEQLVEYAREIARALWSVHKQAEAVRDLTPDNIIFRDGLAFFVDLSTTNMEYTPGFKPPELDGGLTGSYSRASDIYQMGILLRMLLQASGLKNKHLSILVEQCLSPDPNQRPTAEHLFRRLIHIQRMRASSPIRAHLKWLFLVVPIVIVAVILDFVMVPLASPDRVISIEDVAGIRANYSGLSEAEKASTAKMISKVLPKRTLLVEENIEALFLTENPMVICQEVTLGIGSPVSLREGQHGYIVGVGEKGIEILTDDGIIIVDSKFREKNIAFSFRGVGPAYADGHNIAIWPRHRNLQSVINGIAQHLGLRVEGEIKGAIGGLFMAKTVAGFLKRNTETTGIMIRDGVISQEVRDPPLLFPVLNYWLVGRCGFMQKNLAADIENCDLVNGKGPIFSHDSNLKDMLAYYGLGYQQTEKGYRFYPLVPESVSTSSRLSQ